MIVPLSLCIGFMLAVLYIDLMFDLMALPHRRTAGVLPAHVLDSIAHYYGRITQNPYVLMFVMLTATCCLIAEIVYDLAPRWAAYSSLFLMAVSAVVAAGKVIPMAQRLSAGKDSAEERTRMIHAMLPFHLVLLVDIVALSAIQFSTVGL